MRKTVTMREDIIEGTRMDQLSLLDNCRNSAH